MSTASNEASFDGALVRYEGRLVNDHGTYRASICDCSWCTGHYRVCAHCKAGDYGACKDGFVYKLTDPEDPDHVLLNAQHKHLTRIATATPAP